MRFLSALFYLLASLPANASLNDVDKTQIFNKNLLKNGGFENGKQYWTASAGTFAVTTSSPMVGLMHATWDAAASANTLTSTSTLIPVGMYGRNGVASCVFTTASGTATHTIQAYDGSNILSSATITSSTTPTRASVNFVMPSSGSLSLRVYANADEPSVAVDDCYLGPSEGYNTGNSAAVSGWTAYTPTFTGLGTVVSSEFEWRRVGDLLEVRGRAATGTTTAAEARLSFPTGLTSVTRANGIQIAGTYGRGAVGAQGLYVLVESAVTYFTFGIQTGAATMLTKQDGNAILGTGETFTLFASVRIVQWAGSTDVFTPDKLANSWSGYHDATCSWARTNTAYGDPTADASCALVERTNINFGTVSTSGSVLPAITFTPSRAGRYYVCATATVTNSTAGQTGAIKLWDGTTTIAERDTYEVGAAMGISVPICGVYVASNTSAKTLSLQTKASSGAINITTVAAASVVEWSIFQIDQSFPMPLMANSVTSSSSGVVRTEAGRITCSASSSIVSQLGNWIASVGNVSAGACVVTFVANTFSAAPYCHMTEVSSNPSAVLGINTVSSSSVTTDCDAASSGADCTSTTYEIMCTGAK